MQSMRSVSWSPFWTSQNYDLSKHCEWWVFWRCCTVHCRRLTLSYLGATEDKQQALWTLHQSLSTPSAILASMTMRPHAGDPRVRSPILVRFTSTQWTTGVDEPEGQWFRSLNQVRHVYNTKYMEWIGEVWVVLSLRPYPEGTWFNVGPSSTPFARFWNWQMHRICSCVDTCAFLKCNLDFARSWHQTSS